MSLIKRSFHPGQLVNPLIGSVLGTGTLGAAEYFLGDNEDKDRKRKIYNSMALGAVMGGLTGLGANALHLGAAARPISEATQRRNAFGRPLVGAVAGTTAGATARIVAKSLQDDYSGTRPRRMRQALEGVLKELSAWPRENVVTRLNDLGEIEPLFIPQRDKAINFLNFPRDPIYTPDASTRALLRGEIDAGLAAPSISVQDVVDKVSEPLGVLRGTGVNQESGGFLRWLRRMSDKPALRALGLDLSVHEQPLIKNISSNMTDHALTPAQNLKRLEMLLGPLDKGVFNRSVAEAVQARLSSGKMPAYSDLTAGKLSRIGKLSRTTGLMGLGAWLTSQTEFGRRLAEGLIPDAE